MRSVSFREREEGPQPRDTGAPSSSRSRKDAAGPPAPQDPWISASGLRALLCSADSSTGPSPATGCWPQPVTTSAGRGGPAERRHEPALAEEVEAFRRPPGPSALGLRGCAGVLRSTGPSPGEDQGEFSVLCAALKSEMLPGAGRGGGAVEDPWEMEVPLFWGGTSRRFLRTSSLWAPKSQGCLHVALLSPGATPAPHARVPECWVSWPRLFRVPRQPLQTAPAALTAPPPGPIHPPTPAAAPDSEHLDAGDYLRERPGLRGQHRTSHGRERRIITPLPDVEARSLTVNPSRTLPGAAAGPPVLLPGLCGGGGAPPAPSSARLSPLQDGSSPGNFQPLPEMRAGRDPRASLLACVPEAFPSPSNPPRPAPPRSTLAGDAEDPRGRLCLDQGFGQGGGCSHVPWAFSLKPLACAQEGGFSPCSRSRS